MPDGASCRQTKETTMIFPRIIGIATATAMLAACQSHRSIPGAEARLEPRSGSSVSGTVSISESRDTLVVQANLSGLRPNAEHGIHIHDNGDCSSADAVSAGGHFNPAGVAHGPRGGVHHAGDLPNLRADASGNARYEAWLTGLKLHGAQGVVGRSVVVHRDPDDYRSQPAGNSGPRVACGVIRN